MFDVEKVRHMTEDLQTFAGTHEIFLTPEILTGDMLALFHRLKINIRAIVIDNPSKPIEIDGYFWRNSLRDEFRKLPVLKISDAAKNFSEHTGIIAIVKKSFPFFRADLTYVVNNRRMNIPVFILKPDEISAIYNRLSVWQIFQRYAEDGLIGNPAPQDFAMRFAQGFKSFLNPESLSFKFLFVGGEQFDFRYDFDDTAIVIQGPLVYENNYTATTLKLYRKIYPNAPIVVSTWLDEATDDFCKICRENSVILLENVLPVPEGPWHINCQLLSSLQGVRYVQKNTSAKFILKTRADQRINQIDFLRHFKNLLETFPPGNDKLHHRIILLDSMETKRMPFYFCDFLAFGHIEDIAKLYSAPLHKDPGEMTYIAAHKQRDGKLQYLLKNPFCSADYDTAQEYAHKIPKLNRAMRRYCIPEVYIARTFYKNHIAPLDETKLLETNWEFTRDCLILIDRESILLDWPKYETPTQYEMRPLSKSTSAFSRWLDLYRNYKPD